jgi:hypothetical protein
VDDTATERNLALGIKVVQAYQLKVKLLAILMSGAQATHEITLQTLSPEVDHWTLNVYLA